MDPVRASKKMSILFAAKAIGQQTRGKKKKKKKTGRTRSPFSFENSIRPGRMSWRVRNFSVEASVVKIPREIGAKLRIMRRFWNESVCIEFCDCVLCFCFVVFLMIDSLSLFAAWFIIKEYLKMDFLWKCVCIEF